MAGISLAPLFGESLFAAPAAYTFRKSTPEQQGGGRSNRNGGGAPMSVVDETIGKGDININLNALGTVTSLATVTIRSQISGYLQQIVFKEGDEYMATGRSLLLLQLEVTKS